MMEKKKRYWAIVLDDGSTFEFFAEDRSLAVCHSAQLFRSDDFPQLTQHASPCFMGWAYDGDL